MKKYIAMVCVTALFSHSGYAGNDARISGPLNVNNRAVLAKIKKDNPVHYQKIIHILSKVDTKSVEEAQCWMKVEFGAENIGFQDLFMLSYPPKKRLDFQLDASSYTAVITLRSNMPSIRFLKYQPQCE
ncbi:MULTISPECIES: hypothetical protein [unclassified Undibacterium]|uniref:hypothetical protein n=1 Tax=unclassified Undibacterium TaxID=2630295 RepID=UPI002AC97051|nr:MULTISPECIES: hypothetical protein [unclassified Undibacterium]MEB0137737.1 hypothetical protein [Undibacterium sp. CCC2.1]MEB0172821.1 hypothetical protein [Undibacterium sp. CCC1.1]MEB0176705.1 hypothetical protein [Undibacterium sp. CCC3.4]MEB0215969.1 hypothetical protein [Undibacterium sp. 5I2]WPX42312.1 hypothetical protein RHM61_13005 [Undibacterium sp. CCC3.4]